MLRKRIVVCLDVRDGKTTKGVKFQGNVEIGDPVDMAERYYQDGVDELVFYDITASHEGRGAILDVVERVARRIFVPFAVGGGIGEVDQMRRILLAGAEKVSVNSMAVYRPQIIREGARRFGSQAVVLGMDVRAESSFPSGYQVVTHGGRRPHNLDALEWAQRAVSLGAGEIVLNSIDADGTQAGYDLPLTRMMSDSVEVPVVASGGAGTVEHVVSVLDEGHADAALVASLVHYGIATIAEIKHAVADAKLPVRSIW